MYIIRVTNIGFIETNKMVFTTNCTCYNKHFILVSAMVDLVFIQGKFGCVKKKKTKHPEWDARSSQDIVVDHIYDCSVYMDEITSDYLAN